MAKAAPETRGAVSFITGLLGIAFIWFVMWSGGLAVTIGSGRVTSGGVTTVSCNYLSATGLQDRQYRFAPSVAEPFSCPWLLHLADVRD